MDIFPTQYSTLSSSALREFLETQYGLDGVSCRLLIHNVSDAYILAGNDVKYIFKIYRDAHRKLPEIKAEVELLNILKANGAKVSYPISAINGEQIQSFNAAEGTRYGVLFTYALGQVVTAMSDEQLDTVGREMATIHKISETIKLGYPRKEYTIETLLNRPLKIVRPAFEGLEGDYNYLKQAVAKVIKKLEQFEVKNFSYGYCQYDFLPKNFHFATDGSITFFDFDFAGKGYLINDIASFYIHYFMETYYGRITQEEADRAFAVFVKGYRKVKSLSDDELKTIPYFGFAFWIFYLGFQYENFDDWSSLFFGPKFLKDRVALIKQWMDWYVEF